MIAKRGNYEFSTDREYIRYAAKRELTDDQCDEVAQYIEDNLFDIIADVVYELDLDWEEEDDEDTPESMLEDSSRYLED